MSAQWYVVRTHANSEKKVCWHLERQGFQIYLPRYLKRRRHARRTDHVAAPLFPRYLFVLFDSAVQRWRAISSTVGVSCLIRNGEHPAPVADGIIHDLRAREDESGLFRLFSRPTFEVGASIRISDGPFADYLGLYEGMKDHERISVLLDLLGRKVRVDVDAGVVAAA
jgi:transcriptional antiterminator RfaH